MIFLTFQTALSAGEGAVLREVAETCLAAVRAGTAETSCYEWFLDEPTGHGGLIEAYKSEAAFLAHLGDLRAAQAPPPPGSNPTLVILGDLGEKMQGSVARWPGTSYFGPLLHGVMAGRASAPIGEDAVFTVARFTVPDELRRALLGLLPELVARVADEEPGTLAYEWFAGDGEIAVIEIYRDEAARDAHMANASPEMRALLGRLDVAAIYYGKLSPATLADATARPGRVYGGARIGGLA